MPDKIDHRAAYSPTQMFVIGSRTVDGYSVEDAVRDYVSLHPDDGEGSARAEVEAIPR
jgi:hypothetical protein